MAEYFDRVAALNATSEPSSEIEGFEPPAGQPPLFMLSNTVDENYLHTLGVSLLTGRDLRLADDKNAPRVSVINETMAQRFFGGSREAIGKRFKIISRPGGNSAADAGGDATMEIVGVVEDGGIGGGPKLDP